MKHLILATAGHVDHGKTTLIKALTGVDTDRLPEEKARGITIELGFAHLQLGDDVSLGMVDVPGHEDFVKNMVGGVGSIDLALMVVAADDGWMPQTEEHLQILEYLGVEQAIVALTKIDLASSPAEMIRARLADSVFRNAPIVPVSTRTGEGLTELRTQLAEICARIPAPADFGKPRLSVDRAFTLRGIGNVITGTLSGGILRRGDAVAVQPTGVAARIRTIQTHNREVEEVQPGTRTALNIPGAEIARGNVITLPQLGEASAVIDVLVRRSPRLPSNARPIKHGSLLRVHHGTATSGARIFFANEEPLGPGEDAIAELRFDHPIFAFFGDRFVLRDSSEQRTIAGALVLDPNANSRKFRSSIQQELLAARAAAPDSLEVFLETQLRRDHLLFRAEALRKTRFPMKPDGAPDLLFEQQWWRSVLQRAAAMIDAEHAAHPDRVGLELATLRSAFEKELRLAGAFDALLKELCARGFARSGEVIQRATHRPSAPPILQPAVARIRAALATKPFDPPSRKELAPDGISQQALRFLRETNELSDIGADVVIGRAALEEMRRIVSEFIRTKGAASVSDLRQALGSSRRVVVPVLEYFDRLGLTRRIGDKRTLTR